MDISIKTFLKAALVVLGIWVAYLIFDILIMIIFAVIITSAVDGWAKKLEKYIPRTGSVVLIYALLVLLVGAISYSVIPLFVEEISSLVRDLPKYYDQVAQYFGSSHSAGQSLVLNQVQDILSHAEDRLIQAGGGALALFRGVFSGISMLVATFILSFYLSLQDNGVKRFLQFIAPKRHEDYVANLWIRTQKKLGKWLQGQLVLGLTVGILVFIGLVLLGVPYAAFLGLIAAIFELVPVAGPIMASIPAIALGFVVSPITGVLTIIFYIIVQQVENHIIVPTIIGRAVGLNPVIIIIAFLIGAKLGGIIGMLLAVPVAAVLVEILRDLGEQEKDILI